MKVVDAWGEKEITNGAILMGTRSELRRLYAVIGASFRNSFGFAAHLEPEVITVVCTPDAATDIAQRITRE